MDITKLMAQAAIQECDVTLADGTVAKFPFKRVGSFEWTRFQAGVASGDPGLMAQAIIRLVAYSLCEADGKQSLTIEQVGTLDQGVVDSMYQGAMQVNRPSGRGKASEPGAKNGSGES